MPTRAACPRVAATLQCKVIRGNAFFTVNYHQIKRRECAAIPKPRCTGVTPSAPSLTPFHVPLLRSLRPWIERRGLILHNTRCARVICAILRISPPKTSVSCGFCRLHFFRTTKPFFPAAARRIMTLRGGAYGVDPLCHVWGFHIHGEVASEAAFAEALVVQARCRDYMTQRFRCPIDKSDAVSPGYGPHLGYMWELRVESARFKAVFLFGHALAWMLANHQHLGGYIHATMHDETLPPLEQLRQEGESNQRHSIFFGHASVPQRQAFFFEPPLSADGSIVDTRIDRVLKDDDVAALRTRGQASLREQWAGRRQSPGRCNAYGEGQEMTTEASQPPTDFVDPAVHIFRGFHIHVDYEQPVDTAFALSLFDSLLPYLLVHGHRPSSTRVYGARENGPHLNAGWEIKFEYRGEFDINVAGFGLAMAWLVCNHAHLPVFAHGVTWEEGQLHEELRAHMDVCCFIGGKEGPPPLRLAFFEDLIAAAAKRRESKAVD